MLVTAVALALFGFILTLVVDVIRRDGRKIIAALEGRSWIAEPGYGRPVTIRFSPRCTGAEPALTAQPGLRAAA
jgi:hypothetical protein